MKYTEFFKYIFYRIYLFYSDNRDGIPKFSSILVLSLVQFFNFLTLFLLFDSNINFTVLKISSLVILFSVVLINYFYFMKNFDHIQCKWENENIKGKKVKGFIVTIYIIGSIILCFGLAGFLGLSHKR